MKLVIGFITYNQASANYLAHFLPSLKKALAFLSKDEYQILAFDNSDNDEVVNRLALEFFSAQEKISINYYSEDKNVGFGSAYNRLLNEANRLQAEYFMVVNPDIVFEEESIFLLLKELEENKKLASVSPKVLRWDFANFKKTNQIDTCGIILKPGLNFKDLGQGETDSGQFDNYKILAPSGAAGVFRMSALNSIKTKRGYFDSRFFMYKEDCDLAYRLKLNKLDSKLVSSALLYHDRTAAFYGKGIKAFLKNRRAQNKSVRKWSFINQHLLFCKFFTKESLYSQIVIVFRILVLFSFSLILEQFNLKLYPTIVKKITLD